MKIDNAIALVINNAGVGHVGGLHMAFVDTELV